MDKDTRNAIERATQKARRLLEVDFAEQLDGVFDVRADGRIASKGGAHLPGRQHLLRDKIVAAIEHKRSSGMKPEEAVADYVRDAAFTALNRFAALKMLEARELVQECVSRGDASSGFVEFCGLAPALKTADGAGYRLYIESIFDELSTEVKVLFDRRDPASVLWPTKLAFDDHHGGPSIQELVIPVITAKLKVDGAVKAEKHAVTVAHDFDAVTNRIFTIRIELGGASKNLFENARKLRPLVLSDDKPVARAAIATGAALEDGRLTLGPGVQATVAFMLTDDEVKTVRIQVLDAETDAVLYLSPKDIPVRLGV